MKKKILGLLLALLAAGTLGCGDTNDFNEVSGQQGNNPGGGPGPVVQEAFLRLAHLAPELGDVDILINGTEIISDASFETISNYLEVPAGATRIEVRAANTATDLLDQTFNLGANTYSTVAVTGIPGANGASSLGLDLLTDDVAFATNTVGVRFVNTIVGSDGLFLTDSEGEILAGPVAYGETSDYIPYLAAIDTNALQLRDANDNIIATYSTVRGGNENIFDALTNAINTNGVNITVFATGNEDNLPGIVVIDSATAGGQTFVSDPDATEG